MKTLTVLIAFGFAFGWQLSAVAIQAGSPGPDISGQWIRTLGNGSVPDARWGDRIEITQADQNLAIQQGPANLEKYRLNGLESAEVLTVSGCANTIRVTKAQARDNQITLTTQIVTKIYCFHGEDPDDPLISKTGAVAMSDVKGPIRLESKIVMYRDRDGLVVETTRPSFPAGTTTTTTTRYRK